MGGARGQQGRFCVPCAREEAGGKRGRSAHAHSRGRCPLGWRACGRRGRARSRRGKRFVRRSRARGGRRCLSSRSSDDLSWALARGGRVCVACAPGAACAARVGAAATVGPAAAGPLSSMGRRIDNSSTRRVSDRATNQHNATAVAAAVQNAVTVEEGAEAGSLPGAKRSLSSMYRDAVGTIPGWRIRFYPPAPGPLQRQPGLSLAHQLASRPHRGAGASLYKSP